MTNFEIIEEYLEKERSAAERAVFEERLRNDAELAADYALYTAMQNDMQQWHQSGTEREALKETLERVTAGSRSKVVPLRWYLLRVAALLVIVLGIWRVMNLGSGGASSKELYEQYAVNEKISGGSRSTGAGTIWNDAINALNDKQYAAAINTFNQISASGTDSLYEANLYLGFCYMRLDNDSAALRYFTQTPLLTGDIKERSLWYRTLLHLKKGERKDAGRLADSVANGGGVYAVSAKQLIKSL